MVLLLIFLLFAVLLRPRANFPIWSIQVRFISIYKLYSNKYAKDNIRMNNILPGFIDSLPEEEFKKRIPLQRYGKVSEISAVVELLINSDI